MDFYHVINRGVEKRDVFLEEGDFIRFIHDMYVFNDVRSAPNYIVKERQHVRQRKMLVHVHAYCLMKNHYHLLLSPNTENGISAFMQKLNMGYSKYFNDKYERSGVLWQGIFKKIHVTRDAHFMYIPYYIHLNPLDFIHPEWRAGAIKNPGQALAFLREYRWSSHLDYLGVKNFPSVIYPVQLAGVLGNRSQYEREIRDVISSPHLANKSLDIEL
ncbi:hypothetical protein A3C20_00930 [Candidatus Kaiserbacteria bacterium RIFCSPHIGHO2_02_FULL_55_25]|uniref:Transposase IS200-like domain-containing protein n=1 Tax=Candidatus Kaiserbacteria bacterium RIFCSPHIGHO2_02_FULL_55_25 TaxID=1798498 RepID=A0A1F6E749_9BACT|nr:MAG: hypothetical protein A2764_03970 [Candidatus Kaiserbacteria bacterium RIFCSPHIGHO2_01_FULL_55_79]OGG69451.1 MAG: hypothetical protein A3C20_00930 [Candidatus Kaiserbacteria bacterium RIFCSPHIGHO2_02_FULL_55_25]OGG77633.1 MAG: hypothetical protein A3F56_00990 [Candidatus Kaiserbacteria bacterium RIFCSPHIGHO2_12_FULL_55_13]OGG83116.1 MAG: hypothetical protein A3A42_00640 [Candidatus Kaiserbacteria bacterium RIFCSPLOWO2_01_FULL_55_25]